MFAFCSVVFSEGMEPLAATIRRRLPTPSAESQPADAPAVSGCAATYAYVRYPVELAEWELGNVLSPNMRKLLALRRFAHSDTGVWETTTIAVKDLLHCGRSTAQKLLRRAEKRGFIHVRHIRGTVIRLILYFGGFPRPEHVSLGLPPLRWDPNFTEPGTGRAQQERNPQAVENSATTGDRGLPKPNSDTAITPPGTVRPTNNERNERTNNELTNDEVRLLKNEQFVNERFVATPALDKSKTKTSYTRAADFVPRNAEEETVKHLAALLGERYINPFLGAYYDYGLRALQEECGIALGKMRDKKHPLRGSPGRYVMWRLKKFHK